MKVITDGAVVIRLSKVVMTGGLAFWAFLVTLGNVTDYETNWAFVQRVMSMDTVFPDSTLTWRAIADPALQTAAYWAIIVTEGLTCLAFLAATVGMAMTLRAPKAVFQRARAFTAFGALLAFALWFIAFMGIAGEWFAMWQSDTWNGQDAAFKFYMTVLAVAIYVFLDTDGEVNSTERATVSGD